MKLQLDGRDVPEFDQAEIVNLVAGSNVTLSKRFADTRKRLEITVAGSGGGGGGDLLAANNLSDVASAATSRTNLGLAIGTDVQAYDAELAAIAGLTSAADKGIQFTGSGTAATFDLTAAGKALLDDAAASNQRTTLGLGPAAIFTYSGTSFPGSPVAGEPFCRTDLDHDLFKRDATRGKWLSTWLEKIQVGARAAISANSYFRSVNGVVMSATVGEFYPYAMTVVGIAWAFTAGSTGTIEVRDDGSAVASKATGAAATGSDFTLDGDVGAGSVVSVFWNSANTPADLIINVYLRRKAT